MTPLRSVDVKLKVNQQTVDLTLSSAATLLHVLRNDLVLAAAYVAGVTRATAAADGLPA